MPEEVAGDHLVVIRIEGMHCHKCEQSIRKALSSQPGVREVEVDFASGQASVLFDNSRVTIHELMQKVADAGYRATSFIQNHDAATR